MFNISSIINETTAADRQNDGSGDLTGGGVVSPPPSAPPMPAVKRMGVVDENGVMSDEFEVGEFDPDVVENWGKENVTEVGEGEDTVRVRVKKFGICEGGMREYIPCLDNVEAIKRLNSTENGEKFERHCPEKGKGLNCLIPAPKGYRTPIPWPRSRDEVVSLAIYLF